MEVKGKEVQKGTKIEFDSPVSSLFLEVIGAENGHRSVCLKLSALETNKSKSLVVKTCTSKAFQKLTKNEMMFYEHIAPHVKSLQLPACYSIHKDSLTIVLEDLTERFCTKDIWSDFSQTQILLCVKSLAMFHAEQSRPLKDGKYDHLPLVKVSDDEFILYWQTRFDNSFQHLKSSREDVFKPEFMSFLSKFQGAQDKLMKLPTKHSTLIHYDAFIGNWMFDSSALPFTKEDVLTKDVDPETPRQADRLANGVYGIRNNRSSNSALRSPSVERIRRGCKEALFRHFGFLGGIGIL